MNSENGGDPTTIESVVNTYTAPASTASAISDTGLFTEYKIKVVISNGGVNKRLPEILQISAVPLGRKTSEQFFQTITPTGTIVPYAGKFDPPEGFLLCDGSVHQKDEFENLYEVLGGAENPYNTDTSIDTATQFQVPNMQGRVAIGENTGVVPSGDVVDGTNNRTMGNTGGHRMVAMHQHRGLCIPRATQQNSNNQFNDGGIVTCMASDSLDTDATPGSGDDTIFRSNSGNVDIFTYTISRLATLATGNIEQNVIPSTARLKDSDLITGPDGNINSTQSAGISLEQMPPYVVTRYIIKV